MDETLAHELSCPGTDKRFGVTIIARPPAAVIDEIRRIQGRLQAVEPDQYYYPGQDLHTTILEIVYGQTPADVAALMKKIRPALAAIPHDLPWPALESAGFSFDPIGCAVNFAPCDEQLQALRAQLRQRLEEIGVNSMTRYVPTAAHVSLLRYVHPLETELTRWVDFLGKIQVKTPLAWTVASLYLTWGANWYGNCSRIQVMGPFGLS